MQQLLYLEVPTPHTAAVIHWLHHTFAPSMGTIAPKPTGGCWQVPETATELAIFLWSLQRTTYLKVMRWGERPFPQERACLQHLQRELRLAFPLQAEELPPWPAGQSIFEALADRYPLTVKYFQRMPQGEADLERVYWWEQRWRQGLQQPTPPVPVVHRVTTPCDPPTYDLVYVGGALGVVHAAVMARLGYRVLLMERLPFGRMNREWNISRLEFQSLIDLGLFTAAEFESLIAREYRDGFNKFFDATSPIHCRAPVLHTPTVLNIALDSAKFLHLCGEKLRQAGGEIWDWTEFKTATIHPNGVVLQTQHRQTQEQRQAIARVLIDAMGTASPIARQLNGGRAYDSVCPTVGAIVKGIAPEVWDGDYGDVLFSHGDISRGRQLIWELFPGSGEERTIYLFHYHHIHREFPGSLLELYEDFFTILPEYRRCDLDQLTWVKPTFGYIPGYFSHHRSDRAVAFDRVLAIGDAASLQSPLVFTGFGSLVRNLPRLTDLLDTALRHDLVQQPFLNQIRAYQSNTAVTWLFSRGMMVPSDRPLPPERVNAMLNTFFGILGQESPELADRFIKDRAGWLPFNRMALRAAWQNPGLLWWIYEMVGLWDLLRWLQSYLSFSLDALYHALFGFWLPPLIRRCQPWLEPLAPQLWFWLLVQSYALTYSVGQPRFDRSLTLLPTPRVDQAVSPR
ncbi:MAG TPA: flavin-dependent dehydrogenase [Thermosynechococcus sp. M3746_W2019_013]|uniref:NAD(P)/FAD-dependent oxidoreductase n=1 Tax=Thermosynechococcus sp. M3746_W2019_013 TaxID=2747806 RepID=UPI001A0FD29A|nr:flavin-dependent dehydrogenase [Thermosynechococcus sp. M3746_W2019_013]HIK22064.1 flavin-dependent dehydrogenase [Thermosynechococcus sp. M3746_W2019_013]